MSADVIVAVERVVLRPNPVELAVVLSAAALMVGLAGNALVRSRGGTSVVAPRRGIRAVARALGGFVLVCGAVVAFDVATLFAGWLLWPVVAAVAVLGLVFLVRGARDVWGFGTGPSTWSRAAAAVAVVAMVAAYGLAVLVRPAWVAAPSGCEQQVGDSSYEPPVPWEPVALPQATTPESAAAVLNVRAPLSFGDGDRTFAIHRSDAGGVELVIESGSYVGLAELGRLADAAVTRAGVRVVGRSSASGGVAQPHVAISFESPDGVRGFLEARDCQGGLHRPNLVRSVVTAGPDRVGDCAVQGRQPVCKAMIEAADAVFRSQADRLDIVPRPHSDNAGNLHLSYDTPMRTSMSATWISRAAAEDDLERLGWAVHRPRELTDLSLGASRDVAGVRLHIAATYDGENHIHGRLWTEPI